MYMVSTNYTISLLNCLLFVNMKLDTINITDLPLYIEEIIRNRVNSNRTSLT